jgi:hypothetical protein
VRDLHPAVDQRLPGFRDQQSLERFPLSFESSAHTDEQCSADSGGQPSDLPGHRDDLTELPSNGKKTGALS